MILSYARGFVIFPKPEFVIRTPLEGIRGNNDENDFITSGKQVKKLFY